MIQQHRELAEEHRTARQRAVAELESHAQVEAELDAQLASAVAAAQQIVNKTSSARDPAVGSDRWRTGSQQLRVAGAGARVADKVALHAQPLSPVAMPQALATVSWHEQLVEVAAAGESSSTKPTFSLAELVQTGAPPGVDATRKEDYLSEADFLRAFACSREQFNALPKWKQKQLKRGAGLF